MEYRRIGNILFVRLEEDERIIESVKDIFEREQLQGGIILSGVGQLKNVTLAYYDLNKKEYITKNLEIFMSF